MARGGVVADTRAAGPGSEDPGPPTDGAVSAPPGTAGERPAPRVGVLALQGDVIEHLGALERTGVRAVTVRTRTQLDAVDGLVIPGGESTTIGTLLVRFGLLDRLRERIQDGLAVFGTCAGMVLLSDALTPTSAQPLIGGIGVRTRRNAFGRQRDSFEARVTVRGLASGPLDAVFIRAPRVEDILDDDVEVLAAIDGYPIVVRHGALLACAFHPELAGDHRLHALFVADLVGGSVDDDRSGKAGALGR